MIEYKDDEQTLDYDDLRSPFTDVKNVIEPIKLKPIPVLNGEF